MLGFPQFSMYGSGIDMKYHAWMEYDSQVDGINGFGGKTEGPVCFEIVCISYIKGYSHGMKPQ